MGIRVYEYGCGRGQIEGLASAIEQMRRRTQFWNLLVEIDNDVRARMEAFLFAGDVETELNSMRERLRNTLRSGSAGPSDDGDDEAQRSKEISSLRSEIRTRLDEVKRIRKENAALHRVSLRELDAERKKRITEVQAGAGLYWANRDEIRRKYEVARAQAMRQGRQLRPQLCDDSGRIKVQFQRGLPVPKAFLQNGRLQIDPVKDSAWGSRSRAERRRASRTRIRIRVNANEDRTPVWVSVPAVLHRPLPQEGVIRGVSLVRERIGLAWRHRVLITVSELPFPDSPVSEEAVGVDLGWRLTDQGLRVAYWAAEDGQRGELILPNSDLSEFKRIGSLQATIVAAHEKAQAAVSAFIVRHGKPDDLQDLMEESLRSASPRALVQLIEVWKEHRFAGDRYIFAKLRSWHQQHIHLWTWQANLRDQLLRRRRELYRRFAANLSDCYGKVFVNDIRLRAVTVKPASSDAIIPVQRQHRFIAAISVLYRSLQDACEKRGVLLNRLKCQGATIACHICGAVDDWSPRTSLTHTCSKCGGAWDQDYNAAMNVMKRGIALKTSTRAGKG